MPKIRSSLVQFLIRVNRTARLVASATLVPFTIVFEISKAITRIPDIIEATNAIHQQLEAAYVFEFDKVIVRDDYNQRLTQQKLTMNYHALKGFAGALHHLFSPDGAAPKTIGIFPPVERHQRISILVGIRTRSSFSLQ